VNRPAIREVLDSMHLYIGESDLRGGALQYREDHEESDGTCCGGKMIRDVRIGGNPIIVSCTWAHSWVTSLF
jgi:hypothetical protein